MYIFILQGEYEMVISDYGRAKSLFAGTDIKIFKRGVLNRYCLTVYNNYSHSDIYLKVYFLIELVFMS